MVHFKRISRRRISAMIIRDVIIVGLEDTIMNRLIILHAVKPLTLGDEVHRMVLLPKPIRIVIIYIFSTKPE